jgi:hypothetical protein
MTAHPAVTKDVPMRAPPRPARRARDDERDDDNGGPWHPAMSSLALDEIEAWPLRVRQSDFRAVAGSVRSLTKEPFGSFEFAPSEGLDLDLVDRVLSAALDEVDHVHTVILPESAIEESEI